MRSKKISRHGFYVGRGGHYLRPSPSGRSGTSSCRPPSVARHVAGDEEVPAPLLCGIRRPILSVVAVARQHAQRRKKLVPRDFCAGRGGISSCRPLLSGTSSETDKSPRNFCAGRRGEYLRLLPWSGIYPATKKSPRDFCAGCGGQYLWPSPSHDIYPATKKSPRDFWAGRGGQQLGLSPSPGISSATKKSPRDLCAGRGGQYCWETKLPGLPSIKDTYRC